MNFHDVIDLERYAFMNKHKSALHADHYVLLVRRFGSSTNPFVAS